MRTDPRLLLLGLALTTQASAYEVPAECPPVALRSPYYPPDLARKGTGGTVVLELTIDDCGLVRDAVVRSGSGHRKLDQSALTAARQWVLPESDIAKAIDGKVERPVSFGITAGYRVVPYLPVDWPASHKRPQYRLDPSLAATFDSAAQARDSMRISVEQHMTPPYKQITNEFFKYGNPADYWLFIVRDGRPNVAARYRLSLEGGQPMVDLGILCDDQPDACAKAQASLLAGLPFAKAR